jgi:predicted secreted hydrolase
MSARGFGFRMPVMAAAALLVLLGGCATMRRELLPYDPNQHGTIAGEWGPHRGAMEWWYLTGVLEGGDGGPYLVQFTIFHFDFKPSPIYMLHLACTDYAANRHIFEQYVSFDARRAYGKGNTIVYNDSSIELQSDSLLAVGAGRDVSFDLSFRISDPPVWHGQDGLISMGHPEDPEQASYYYSLVRMQTAGWLACLNKNGERPRREVSGWSWFDRQWGTFQEKGWDWFSLRFSDGDRIMLFCFPRTGHREGTWVRSDGTASTFPGFDYSVGRWLARGGHRYGLDWRLELPVKQRRYRVEPLYLEDFNPNPANDYWEGLCRLLDENGNPVGDCVVETTGPAHD